MFGTRWVVKAQKFTFRYVYISVAENSGVELYQIVKSCYNLTR